VTFPLRPNAQVRLIKRIHPDGTGLMRVTKLEVRRSGRSIGDRHLREHEG